ncbi:1433_t:CDS:2, partial [Entrophospora sp. SA101]
SQSNTSLIVRRMSNLNSEVIQEDVEMEDVDELVETPIKNSPNLSSKKRVIKDEDSHILKRLIQELSTNIPRISEVKEREALQESIQGNLPEHEAQKKINNEVRDQLPKEISKPTI